MLEIKNLTKEYHVGDISQRALDHISLNLRDNEFVAILGASGSGKTTLLNMIGGLDRYDEGDLLIDGISTRNYKDRDWDTYRNHTIGFVFQSYNLIGHQSVLANVELALTISGVSGAERRKRAVDALREVGLEDHINKKPNQLSGGQMQRVAIARALVNNPKILLADEPTGALDSVTSIQVMDLLKKVARDRLVVMVTHNPELAKRCATRIVRISDGRVVDDTDPFEPAARESGAGGENASEPGGAAEESTAEPGGAAEEGTAEPGGTGGEHGAAQKPEKIVQSGRKSFGRSSMSFLTALSLSFNNLRTKKARTFMVSFAGSIGIIGIALVLALSNGVTGYVRATEEAALSSYPLEISRTGIDLSTLISENSGSMPGREQKKDIRVNDVGVDEMAGNLLSGVNSNDLTSLKKYFESGESGIDRYVSAIEYSYDVTPQIYRQDDTGTYQLNPNTMLSSMLTSIIDVSSLMSGVVGESLFHALPENDSLYRDLYDVKAGRWPENDHELVLVLSAKGEVTDVLLYELGIWDSDTLEEMIQGFSVNGSTHSIEDIAEDTLGDQAEAVTGVSSSADDPEGVRVSSSSSSSSDTDADAVFPYDTFLGRTFKLVQSSDYYTKDEQYGVWTDHSDDDAYVSDLVSRGEDLTIVGIVQPKNGENIMALQSGIDYPHSLVTSCIEQAAESEPVKEQLANEEINIFTGKPFGEDDNQGLDLGKMVTLDHDAVAEAFSIDTDALASSDLMGNMQNSIENGMQDAAPDFSNMDLSDLIDMNALADALPDLSSDEIAQLMSQVKINATQESMTALFSSLVSGYLAYAANDPTTDYSSFPDALRSYLSSDTALAIIRDQAETIIGDNIGSMISEEKIRQILTDSTQAYIDWVQQQESGGSTPNVYDPAVFAQFLSSDAGRAAVQAVLQQFSADDLMPTDEQLQNLITALADGYDGYAAQNSLPQPSKLADSFASYLGTEDAQKLLTDSAASMIDTSQLESAIRTEMEEAMQSVGEELSGQVQSAADAVIAQVTVRIEEVLTSAMLNVADQVNENMGDFFKIDEETFGKAIRMNMTPEEIQSLLTSILTGEDDSCDGNLQKLGYADLDSPEMIEIYAKDFESKNDVTRILDDYNEKMREAGDTDRVITYTDMVGTMMSSITQMIHTVSYVLIAFVAISLVVSSIMIGVITYISVLERRKEIGILRALGASKRNVAQVFNAETFITGALAGGLGVGITLALIPIVNYVIKRVTGETVRAMLTPGAAVTLMLLSIALTLIAGLIPAGKAAKSDPVEALRTE